MAITLNNSTPLPASTPRAAKAPSSGQKNALFRSLGSRVKATEVLFFTSQLSLMLEIGTPMNKALKAIKDQTENPAFQRVLQDMLEEVEGGRQLSDAMKQHPRVFNSVTASMIKAGETGGFLKEILERITEMQEKRQALKTQLRAALTYPVVLCVVAILVVIFILVVVLPKFTSFFAGKESILPFSTRFLMILSASLKAYWWVYVLGALGLAIGIYLFKKSNIGGIVIDRVTVSGPLIGRLSNKIFNCQLLRTLGNLMESHVPLMEALEVTRGTVKNRYFKDFIEKIMDHVREGGRFARPFATYTYTLESVKQMVATGEETGNLPKVMLRLAEFYDTEVERELKNFASLLEPVALIVLGGVVGLIVSSVILPMFKLAHAVN